MTILGTVTRCLPILVFMVVNSRALPVGEAQARASLCFSGVVTAPTSGKRGNDQTIYLVHYDTREGLNH